MRLPLWTAFGWIAACVWNLASPAQAFSGQEDRQSDPPNIVFVFVDDLGIFDLGCYGREDHKTPNLDRLAQQGARFTNAYAAASVCSPTRAALMTGKAPAELRITTFLNGRPNTASQKLLQAELPRGLSESETTIASDLSQVGYRTGIFGKWHLGGGPEFNPTRRGFDEYQAGTVNTKPSVEEGGKGEYQLTSLAIDFLKRNQDRPFFLYLAHNTPHIPYNAQQRLIDRNPRAFEPVYAALIEAMDETVGQLLGALDDLGLTDNTIVVYTSDNGGLHVPEGPHPKITHNGPYRAGKGFLYEGGIRVPMIVRWPGQVPAGEVVSNPVLLTDWRPTLRDLVGLPPLEELDGVSLLGLLNGQGDPPPADRALCWHEPHYTNQGGRPGAAIRSGDWKLIEFFGEDQTELYNLAEDPGERQDLHDSEPEQVKMLIQKLRAWQERVNAVKTEPNPNLDPELFQALYVDFDPSKYNPASADEAEFQRVQQWRKLMNQVVAEARR